MTRLIREKGKGGRTDYAAAGVAVEGPGFDGGGGGSGGVAGGSGRVEAGGEVHWWAGWVGETMGEEGGIEWIGDFENVLFDGRDCEQAHWKGELLLELEVMGSGLSTLGIASMVGLRFFSG